HFVPQRRGQDIDALGRALPADDLRAEQPPGPTLDNHLDFHRLRARVVVRPARCLRGHTDGVETRSLGLPLGEPGAGYLHPFETGDRRAKHATKRGVTAGDVGASNAALLVSMRAEGHHDGPAGHAMARLDAVTGGPDVRRAGAQGVVDDDAAGLA